MMNKVIFSAVTLLLVLAACGTETSTEGDEGSIIDPYGDPPGYSGDPFAGYGPVTSIEFPAGGENQVPVYNNGKWSVQVAACATEAAALSLAEELEAFGYVPVFIDHVGSYYKVRVGAFETSEESSELRNRLRAGSYPDAWSVEREITP